MNARTIIQVRSWDGGVRAGLLACSIALLVGETRGRPDRPARDPLAGYPRVRHLDYSLGDLGSVGLEALVGATDLRGLDLFGTRVDDEALEIVGGLADLETLYLESTPVGDDGLAHLRNLTRLRTLTLSGTRVTDAGLVHLERLTGLRALDLSYTSVTEAGIAGLRRALPGTEITTERGRDADGAISARHGGGEKDDNDHPTLNSFDGKEGHGNLRRGPCESGESARAGPRGRRGRHRPLRDSLP